MARLLVALFVVVGLLAAAPTRAQEPAEAPAPAQPLPPLRVATVERPPFAMRNGDDFNGFSVELWREVASAIDRETVFVEAPDIPSLLEQVRSGEADAAIANITVSSKREAFLDFSQPMFDAGLRILVRSDGSSSSVFRALFNAEILGLVALATVLLFVIGNVMWLLERGRQDYFRHGYGEGAFRGFWWALNVIVNGGFEERMPQTWLGRLFAVFLVVASLFVVSAFVAQITATITVSELQSQIGGLNDLYGKRVGTTQGSTAADFLDQRSLASQGFPDIEDLFEALEDGRLDAVVHDAPILSYYAATRGRGQVQVVGEMLQPEKYGIAFPEGSPLVEPVNRALLRLREDGTIANLNDRWFEAR